MNDPGDENDAKTKPCPKCGSTMVRPESIGLSRKGWGDWYCSLNMPYQGCGYQAREAK